LYDRVLGVAIGDAAAERQGPRSLAHAGAIAKFLVARPGIVRAVHGLDAAQSLDGVDDAQVFVPVGGRVMPLTDSAKRAAYVLAHASTRREATERADAALAHIRIDTQQEELRAETGA